MKLNYLKLTFLSILIFSLTNCGSYNKTSESISETLKFQINDQKLFPKAKHLNLKDNSYFNFRGTRKAISDENLSILSFSINKKNTFTFFEIKFNQSINPLSLNAKDISINQVQLDESTDIRYNKSADTISFQILNKDFSKLIGENEDMVTVEISNIQSFDGKSTTEKLSESFSLK